LPFTSSIISEKYQKQPQQYSCRKSHDVMHLSLNCVKTPPKKVEAKTSRKKDGLKSILEL
jgi:hypothetical protein